MSSAVNISTFLSFLALSLQILDFDVYIYDNQSENRSQNHFEEIGVGQGCFKRGESPHTLIGRADTFPPATLDDILPIYASVLLYIISDASVFFLKYALTVVMAL